jgi:hypothetical protein
VHEDAGSDRERVRRLLSRAGIHEPLTGGHGTLATEPLLVFSGHWRSSLDIFDQYARQIGTAERTKTRYKDVGHHCRYELRDTAVVAELRDTTKRRFPSRDYTFSVFSGDGAEVASARRQSGNTYSFARGDQPIATLRQRRRRERLRRRPVAGAPPVTERLHGVLDRLTSRTFDLEDTYDQHVARIEYLRSDYLAQGVNYVVDLGSVREPLRSIALVACLVVDNRVIDLAQSGAGA